MKWLLLLLLPLCVFTDELHLTTDDAGYLTVIQGFATDIHCVLNTCSDKVVWYKDDILLFNGTTYQKNSGFNEKSFLLNHRVDINSNKGCMGECSTNAQCEPGHSCIDNQCCACSKEEFSLILKNLTFEDSGRYRCQIANQSELLEFQVEVLESGLKGGFHENISYDHSQCCEQKGISTMCKGMCKPSEMGKQHFDPTSCKTDDYKNFLSCATDGGNRSHVHCCKTQMVPSFCYDFCSGDFQMLRRSHRLCLYYLPEIFECYNRAYLPYPDPPQDVIVNAVNHDQLSVCWKPPKPQPSNIDYPVQNYSVFYKQIPSFPFFPGGDDLASEVPFLNGGDYGDLTDILDEDYEEVTPITSPLSTTTPLPQTRRKRSFEKRQIEVIVDGRKEKRQSWVLVTKDETTNTSTVREFNFEHVNTTDTCVTLKDLRGATRYAVYVVATNGYGDSVPSLRSITSTNVHVLSSDESAPDSMQCCKDAKVSDFCLSKMCDATANVSMFSTISISTSCRHEWPKVSPCIADGRNHTECCKRRGVQAECLPICAGSTEELSIHSMLCLNLDLSTIFQCLREGYESHPSSPVNVTVDRITTTSAVISWAAPLANAHLVESYSIFLRRNNHGAPLRQVVNATSPYTEQNLLPDSTYAVSVQSHSDNGTSLPSTTILFQTMSPNGDICPRGKPLMLSNGRPLLCDSHFNACPSGYGCVEFLDDNYCCEEDVSSNAFHTCCLERGITGDCLDRCNYNATSLPETCAAHLNTWVQCGSEGHDHSRCCEQIGLVHECQTGCRHPFQVPDNCVGQTDKLLTCFSSHHSRLPVAVQNPRITVLNKTGATIEWNAAMNGDIYEVQWFSNHAVVNRTNTTSLAFNITNLQPKMEYMARVIAFNIAGSAPPSWNVTFTTLPEKDLDGSSPKAPRALRIEWNHGSVVNVTWNPVTHRRDELPVESPIVYTLSYVDVDSDHQWDTPQDRYQETTTNEPWALMTGLKEDGLYSVYVTAKEGDTQSRSSSVISILAQRDSYGLPEPTIKVMPEKHIYGLNESITIECALDDANGTQLNLDLTVGDKVYHSDKGVHLVVTEVKTTGDMDTITCSVTESDGRQNVQMKHIMVKYGPIAIMDRTVVHAFDDMSAQISCTVSGFPIPSVRFEKDGKIIGHSKGEEVRIRSPSLNTFQYTLVLRNSTGKGGLYHCIAERDDEGSQVSRQTAELITDRQSDLPANPTQILDCCEGKGVQGDCLQACSIGKIPPNVTCKEYSHAFITCAEDIKDHSDCCAAKGVRSRCLPLCAGDSISPDIDCSQYAVDIVSCFVRGHISAPQQPRNVNFDVIEPKKVKITWDDPSRNKNVFYAVYYKKKDSDDDDYNLGKTTNQSIVLDIDPNESYDIGVLAANSFGHSPLTFLQIEPSSNKESTSSGNGSFTFLIILFSCCTLIIIVVVLLGRRKALPLGGIFGGKPLSHNDPTVAFENPGFNSEVEIRGLGSGNSQETDWQSHELQVSNDTEYRGGMRYSKLEG